MIQSTHRPEGASTAAIAATYIDHMGSDLSVVNAARVSFGKESGWEWKYPISDSEWDDLADSGWQQTDSTCLEWKRLSDKDAKLIRYLAKHKHLSPFGHAFASFHVKAPIFVARQLVKHKFLRWNEISRRYVDDEPEFYVPDQWRGRSADKKQGSDGVVDLYWGPEHQFEKPLGVYKKMLECGVAPEQARMVLPQSTMTEWYWSGSLDAFAAMCRLRCALDTQYESRIVADQISAKMSELFPVSWDALMTDWGVVVSDGRRATEDDVPPWEYKELEADLAKAMKALGKVQAFVRELEPYAAQGTTLVPALREACDTFIELKGDGDE